MNDDTKLVRRCGTFYSAPPLIKGARAQVPKTLVCAQRALSRLSARGAKHGSERRAHHRYGKNIGAACARTGTPSNSQLRFLALLAAHVQARADLPVTPNTKL